LDRQF